VTGKARQAARLLLALPRLRPGHPGDCRVQPRPVLAPTTCLTTSVRVPGAAGVHRPADLRRRWSGGSGSGVWVTPEAERFSTTGFTAGAATW